MGLHVPEQCWVVAHPFVGRHGDEDRETDRAGQPCATRST